MNQTSPAALHCQHWAGGYSPLILCIAQYVAPGLPTDLTRIYCCRLSVRNRVTKRTRVVWNSRCPKWNEEFRFLVHFPGAVPPAAAGCNTGQTHIWPVSYVVCICELR
jgi:C2 domain